MKTQFLDPGVLRVELVLEDAATVQDETGGLVETWQEVAAVFAHVEPVRARAIYGADRLLADITHHITLRHRADLTTRMRFRREARVFEIRAIRDPDETGRYQICLAREWGR